MKTPRQGRQSLNTGRRARTPLNTYYRAGSGGSDSPFQKKKSGFGRRRIFFGFLDIVLAALIVAGLVYSLLVSPHPKILLNSTAFHGTGQYQAAADDLFSSFKNRNKVTFSADSVSAGLKKKFPEIIDVRTELPVFSEKPTLRLNISKASLRLKSGSLVYIVDSQGAIVAREADFPLSGSLPEVTDNSGFYARVGSRILSQNSVDFIRTLQAQCRKSGIKISSLTLPAVAQELDLRAKDQKYFVKFFFGGDVLTQAGQYLAARHHFNQTHSQPADYLDVRVNGKIFFK